MCMWWVRVYVCVVWVRVCLCEWLCVCVCVIECVWRVKCMYTLDLHPQGHWPSLHKAGWQYSTSSSWALLVSVLVCTGHLHILKLYPWQQGYYSTEPAHWAYWHQVEVLGLLWVVGERDPPPRSQLLWCYVPLGWCTWAKQATLHLGHAQGMLDTLWRETGTVGLHHRSFGLVIHPLHVKETQTAILTGISRQGVACHLSSMHKDKIYQPHEAPLPVPYPSPVKWSINLGAKFLINCKCIVLWDIVNQPSMCN